MKQDVLSRKKKLKTIVLTVLCAFVALALVLVAFKMISAHFSSEKNKADAGIYYYPAKYDEDIFKNKAYVGYERDVMYSDGTVTSLFSYENDLEVASLECRFFMEYFHNVIYGNCDEITNFYVDGFFKSKPNFTMQMIYDPYVKFHSTTVDTVNGEEVTLYNFQVRYKIFKNNGTFRRGIESNTAVPQIYQLVKVNDQYKILRILDIDYEN